MKKEDLAKAFSEIDDKYLMDADQYKPTPKRIAGGIKMLSVLGFIVCIILICTFLNKHRETNENDIASGGIKNLDIYNTTILVEDKYYHWAKSEAYLFKLPKEAEFYGRIVHTNANYPSKDCEMTSSFDVEGIIYVDKNNPQYIYLVLTTEWLNEGVIRFEVEDN